MRRFLKSIIITVSDIDIFQIVFIFQITIQIAVILSERNIGVRVYPGVGQLTGRGYFPRDNIGKCCAARSTKLAEIYKCVNSRNLFHKAGIKGRSNIQCNNRLFIMLCTEKDVFLFNLRKLEVIIFKFSILSFPGLACNNIDTGISITLRYILFRDQTAKRKKIRLKEHGKVRMKI